MSGQTEASVANEASMDKDSQYPWFDNLEAMHSRYDELRKLNPEEQPEHIMHEMIRLIRNLRKTAGPPRPKKTSSSSSNGEPPKRKKFDAKMVDEDIEL